VVEVSLDLEPLGGTPQNRTFRGITSLPTSMAAGSYRLVGIGLADALGNSATYGPAGSAFTPFPASIDPVVAITNAPLPGPYQAWLAAHPSIPPLQSARDSDPDGDQFPNLVELALGTDPMIPNGAGSADPNQSHAPVYVRQGNELQMLYILATENLGTGPRRISVFPQESSDLKSWDSAAVIIDGSQTTTAFIRVTKGQRKWLRLFVYDPAADIGP
jgi:hypothetical protein